MADANTVLLLHYDGSTVDASPSAHSTTAPAFGASVSTTQKKFGSGSLNIGVSGGYHLVTDKLTDFNFGSGSFTAEAWVYPTSSVSSGIYGVVTQFGTGGNFGWFLGLVGGALTFFWSTTGADNPSIGAVWTSTLNQWHHVAADRDALGILRVYVDGVVIVSSAVTAGFYASTSNVAVGNDLTTNRAFPGYIDEVRISKGVARYGGAFTPPTAAFNGAAARPVLVLSQ